MQPLGCRDRWKFVRGEIVSVSVCACVCGPQTSHLQPVTRPVVWSVLLVIIILS